MKHYCKKFTARILSLLIIMSLCACGDTAPTDVRIEADGKTVKKLEVALTEDADTEMVLTAVIEPEGAKGELAWTTSDKDVVRLRDNGDGTCTVKLKNNGEATVTVTCGDVSAKVKLTVASAAAGNADPSKTLWGKKVTPEFIPLPEKALHDDVSKCYGIAPDGVTLLMGDAQNGYLYNLETGRELSLYPVGGETEELLRMAVGRLQPEQSTEEAEKFRQRIEEADSAELLGMLLTEMGRVPYAAFTELSHFGSYVGGNELFVTNRAYSFAMVIDCSAGAYCLLERTPSAIRDNSVLSVSAPESGYYLTDLETGRTKFKDLEKACTESGLENGGVCTAANYLPDGSIAAVFRDGQLDFARGEENVLLFVSPDEKETAGCSLGRIPFGQAPDIVFGVDSEYVLAASRSYFSLGRVYLINRKTLEVSLLYVKGSRICSVPLADCLVEGVPQAPESDSILLPMGACRDGQTALLYCAGGSAAGMLLFRPASMETQKLIGDVPVPVNFLWNGYDTVYSNLCEALGGDFRSGYLKLNIK